MLMLDDIIAINATKQDNDSEKALASTPSGVHVEEFFGSTSAPR